MILSLRLLWRECCSGQLNILIFSIVIAVCVMTNTSLLTDRIEQGIIQQGAKLLGGDLKISSPRKLSPHWLNKAQEFGVAYTETMEFPTVVSVNEQFLLVGLKVVDEKYPLMGKLEISRNLLRTKIFTNQIPKPSEIWVDQQLLTRLSLKVGDSLIIGEYPFKVGAVLIFEPDRSGSFVSLSPRVLMNSKDLAKTGLVRPGSRIRYETLFAGKKYVEFRSWVEPKLDISQRISGLVFGRAEIGNSLLRASSYLSAAGLLTIILSGAAIALTARRWAETHLIDSALIRTLGFSNGKVCLLFSMELLILGCFASLIGVSLAYGFNFLLIDSLGDLISIELPDPGSDPLILGFLTGTVTLLGFAAPSIFLLGNVAPLKIIKRDIPPKSLGKSISYVFAIFSLGFLAYLYTKDFELTVWICVGILSITVVTLVLAKGLTFLSGIIGELPIGARFGISQLVRDPYTASGQIISFSATIMAVSLVFLIRFDLISTWEKQVPFDAPNAFAFNILATDKETLGVRLEELKSVRAPFYPIVRGRLDSINNDSLQSHLKRGGVPQRVKRELALTETSKLGQDNRIVAGRWFANNEPPNSLTIEAELAQELNVQLGDLLTLEIGAEKLTGKVIGIREVQWDSMLPNFFLIFSPGSLTKFNSTLLTSMRLKNPDVDINKLVKDYPGITILSTQNILKQVRNVLNKVTEALTFVLWFVVLGAILVMMASVEMTLPVRQREAALLRSLGASNKLIKNAQWSEFASLGFFSGFLGIFGTEITGYFIYTKIFSMEWHIQWFGWIFIPLISAFFIGFIGGWASRITREKSPAILLRLSET